MSYGSGALLCALLMSIVGIEGLEQPPESPAGSGEGSVL